MIITHQNGRFLVYDPKLGSGRSASVPITGDDAYIVVTKSSTEVTFTGEAWDGKVSLSEGLNLMAVPVNPGEMCLSDLAQEIGSNLSSIFWYNQAVGEFVAYQPKSRSVDDVLIRAGQGYVVSMKAPANLTIGGKAWENTPADVAAAPAFADANRTTTPLFIVEGSVLRKDISVGAESLPRIPKEADKEVFWVKKVPTRYEAFRF